MSQHRLGGKRVSPDYGKFTLPPLVPPPPPPPPRAPPPPKRRPGRPKSSTKERKAEGPGRPPGKKKEVPSDLAFSKEIARIAQAAKVQSYGMLKPEEAILKPRWEIEFLAWKHNPPGGLGRLAHFRNLAQYMWPQLRETWNPWMDRQIQSLVRENDVQRVGKTVVRSTTWIGCGAGGKTFASGLFALLWWSIAPTESIVILTSTTRDMVRKRVWSEIRGLYDTSVDLDSGKLLKVPGFVMESRTSIQASKADDKHAIFAMAVAHGETPKAVAMMKGIHARRMMLVIDEANGTPESIFRTIPNLVKGCDEFNLLFIGNPTSHLDCLGMVSEPARGWSSVTVDHDTWQTKGVQEWQIPPGICEHFDGFRSPNVLLGETKWPFIYTWENYQIAHTRAQNTLEFWQNDRGFYAGEGTINTVFTEGLVERCGGYDRPPFITRATPVAFLDPAFGGDDCVLQFGEVGMIAGGNLALVLTEMLILNPLADATKEKEYVIADQTIRACKARDINPRDFGVDAIGTGRGAAAVLATEWDPGIQKFYSNERPSDEVAAFGDKAASEEYDRATTEHWFRARDLLQAGQLKGLYREAVIQFCSRQYSRVGRVYRLSSKEEHKDSVASRESPDKADAIVGLCWVARGLGLAPIAKGAGTVSREREETEAEEIHAEENAYAETDGYDDGT